MGCRRRSPRRSSPGLAHYAEKVRQVRYHLDEAEINRTSVNAPGRGLFDCDQRLFGLTFHRAAATARAYHRTVATLRSARRGARSWRLPARKTFARATSAAAPMDEPLRESRARLRPRRAADSPEQQTNSPRARPASRTCSASRTRARMFHEFAMGCMGCVERGPTSGSPAQRDAATSSSCTFETFRALALRARGAEAHAASSRNGEADPRTADARCTSALLQSRLDKVRYTASALVDMARARAGSGKKPVADVVAFERAELSAWARRRWPA